MAAADKCCSINSDYVSKKGISIRKGKRATKENNMK
jgi:hypothetical protein